MADILFSLSPKDIVIILILLSLMIMSFFVEIDEVEINFSNTVKFLLFSILILFLSFILSSDGISLLIFINFLYLVIFISVKSDTDSMEFSYQNRPFYFLHFIFVSAFSAFINFVLLVIYGYAHILQNFIMTKI